MTASAQHTYFLDRNIALREARKQRSVLMDSGIETIQMCFYDGKPFPNPPANLVHVPAKDFLKYFTRNPRHLPSKIHCQKAGVPNRALAKIRASFMEMVVAIKKAKKGHLTSLISLFSQSKRSIGAHSVIAVVRK